MGNISGSSARAAGYRPPILGMAPQQNEQVDMEAGVTGEEQHQQDTERQRYTEQCSSSDGVVLRRAQRRELLVVSRVDH